MTKQTDNYLIITDICYSFSEYQHEIVTLIIKYESDYDIHQLFYTYDPQLAGIELSYTLILKKKVENTLSL